MGDVLSSWLPQVVMLWTLSTRFQMKLWKCSNRVKNKKTPVIFFTSKEGQAEIDLWVCFIQRAGIL